MVFSAVPLYLDHPNWHHQLQQPNYQPNSEVNSLQPSLPPAAAGGGGSSGSIRPGSMSDRARLAKIPQPEPGLKCPRCESTNTKFCYFNNYSLTQPRHFCKTCRRYWTRGGALRNVPVGGGCRRNKKSKSSGSKSQAIASTEQQAAAAAAQASASPSSCSTDMSAHFPHPSPQLPFIAALQNLVQYGGGNMGGFQPQMAAAGGGGLTDVGFQMGNSCANSGGSGGADHWRLPILGGFDSPNNLYPYDHSEAVEAPITSMLAQSHLGRSTTLSSAMSTQLPPVKMEENQGLNFSRHLARAPQINPYWGGNTWTEFSGLNSSSQ